MHCLSMHNMSQFTQNCLLRDKFQLFTERMYLSINCRCIGPVNISHPLSTKPNHCIKRRLATGRSSRHTKDRLELLKNHKLKAGGGSEARPDGNKSRIQSKRASSLRNLHRAIHETTWEIISISLLLYRIHTCKSWHQEADSWAACGSYQMVRQ